MKNKSLYLLFVALLVSFVLTSCKKQTTVQKPGSHARISEMLVVMDKTLWQSDLGDTVRNYFGQLYPYLNQPEPWFNIIYRTPEEFDKTYSIFRNILYFVLEPNMDGGNIQKETDYWAKPQTVIQINGMDSETLKGLFLKNQKFILKAFDDSEVRRLKGVMNSISKPGNATQITDQLQLSISVPEGYYIAKKESGFVWSRKVIQSKTQESAFWVAVMPYHDTAQFNPENAMKLRDSICKAQIPVQDTLSYMGTEYRFGYLPKITTLNGYYALETRGLWRTFGNYSMGGPFINFLIHDEKKGRLIMIDGYVFKPNENKRDLIRQLEGIIHTLKL